MLTKKKFEKYHAENPKVFEIFSKFTFEAISSRRTYFGAKMIAERLRWHSMIETNGDPYKINNNYVSFYARLFEYINPQYKGFFKMRVSAADIII